MSNLEAAVRTLATEVQALDARMQDMEASQKALARQTEALAREAAVASQAMSEMRTQFSTFLVRFNEVVEMLVQHDTDALKWRAQIERRLDTIEDRLAS